MSRKRGCLLLGPATVLLVLYVSLFQPEPSPTAGHTVLVSEKGQSQSDAPTLHPTFDKEGRYVLQNYDVGEPFTSFLPGIAGTYGKPAWTFYVSKGQAVTSFGLSSKDSPIMQFSTAGDAYQRTAFVGFRTFIKGKRDGENSWFHQPFFPHEASVQCPLSNNGETQRDMHVGMNDLMLNETHEALGLNTAIEYFTVAHEDFPGLLRTLTITNTKNTTLHLEVLDGMAKIQPYGVTDSALDKLARTIQSWYMVDNLDKDATLPYFRLRSSFIDAEVVTPVVEGTFAMFYEEGGVAEGSNKLLPVIVDPGMLFGHPDSTLMIPTGFQEHSLEELMKKPQVSSGRIACAMAGTKRSLEAGQSLTLVSLYGLTSTLETLTDRIAPAFTAPGFTEAKRQADNSLAEELTSNVEMKSGLPLFDAYVRYNNLDNLIRGGAPQLLGDPAHPRIFHTFSRIHGDPERDYNPFQIAPTFFSIGSGNYRDVNQNRRTDVLLEPRVGDFNIRTFLSLIQADGYNPLTVKSATFIVDPSSIDHLVLTALGDKPDPALVAQLTALLRSPVLPGDLFESIETAGIKLKIPRDTFINLIAAASNQNIEADFSQGFWSDHWTYILDQFNSYLTVFPDKLETLLFDLAPMPFFFSPATCANRSAKYVLLNDQPMQLNAVYEDSEKRGLLDAAKASSEEQKKDQHWQRAADGSVYTVPAISKLLLLASLKFTLLDPQGMGVTMEGGKPGWLDAMNGLPALFGSGMPETYELQKMLQFIHESVTKIGRPVPIPEELGDMLGTVWRHLEQYEIYAWRTGADFEYWNDVTTAREEYRGRTRKTFSGTTVEWSAVDVVSLVGLMTDKVAKGIDKAVDMNDGIISPCYFRWEMTDYGLTGSNDSQGRPIVYAKAWSPIMLPNFLEGPVRQMKVLTDVESRRTLYAKVFSSALYDKKLKMYRICESLEGQPETIGRAKAFPAGWLENQSVWLHMSYKYYVELLRGGLYEEFWFEARTGIVAFMDPAVYGRSPLEASSFIVSSAHADETLHGRGFLSRMSGSTAEFGSMWFIIVSGQAPFRLNAEGDLELALSPVLPGWLFDSDDCVSFTFLGSLHITYHNPSRLDTWTTPVTRVIAHPKGGSTPVVIEGGVLTGDLAIAARERGLESMDIYF